MHDVLRMTFYMTSTLPDMKEANRIGKFRPNVCLQKELEKILKVSLLGV